MHPTTCKNCDQSFEGNFCPNCGQTAHIHRINLHYFLHDIPHSVLHIDKGFFYTLRRLNRRPGAMLAEYIEGKRVNHFRPVAFVIIMSTICGILTNMLNYYFLKKDLSRLPFFAKYPSALIFLLIPLISLITWICFSRRKYNYWEHLLFNTYLGAYLNVFLLIVTIFQVLVTLLHIKLSMFVFAMIMMFLFMTYYSFAYGELMHEKKKWALTAVMISLMDGLIATTYFTSFAYTGIYKFW